MKKQTAVILRPDTATLGILAAKRKQASTAADRAARQYVFHNALLGKATKTKDRKEADLLLFEKFLQEQGVWAQDMFHDPQAWKNVTFGFVDGFKLWLLKQGYAIATINGRLSTVRTYAKLASQAGAIPADKMAFIAAVKGYNPKEARNVDDWRRDKGLNTRVGHKKSEAVSISPEIAETMKHQPLTPQGRKDALLMCLLLDHGLRVSEAALLTTKNFDLQEGTFQFYQPKVDKTLTHSMSPATRNAAKAYIPLYAPASGILWRKSHKGTGELSGQMSKVSTTRALTKRVELLGRRVGLIGLSAHDCRHFAATYEARKGTPIDRLVSIFGWKSYAMAKTYIEATAISNEGSARLKMESKK